MSDSIRILHAALLVDWDRALLAGRYAVSSRGVSLADEGFIHASTRSQVDGVLERYYADLDALVLLVLDVDALVRAGSPVRWDDVPGAASPFPHIYGSVPTAVVGQDNPVVAALPFARAGEQLGTPGWLLPDLTRYDVAP
jgi:uncharacterized protein (DUF952 family)